MRNSVSVALVVLMLGVVASSSAQSPRSLQSSRPVQSRRRAKPPTLSPPTVTPPVTDPPASVQPNVIKVKSPQDAVPLDSGKIHELSVAVNYLCVVTLPEPCKQLIVGNLANFKTWALEEEKLPAEGEGGGEPAANAKFILIKPVKTAGEEGFEVETNLTIRLASDRLLFFRLRLAPPENTVYRVQIRDLEAEEREKAERLRGEAEERRRAALEKEEVRREAEARRRLRQLTERLTKEPVKPEGNPRPPEGFTAWTNACVQFDGFLAVAVRLEAKRAIELDGEPVWTLDGKPVKPAFYDRVMPTVLGPRPEVVGCVFKVGASPVGQAALSLKPGGKGGSGRTVTMTAAVKVEMEPSQPPAPPGSPNVPRAEPRIVVASDDLPDGRTDPRPSPPSLGPSESTPSVSEDIAGRLRELAATTNVRTDGLTTVTEREYAAGLRVERRGGHVLAVVCLERKLGATRLPVSGPTWTWSNPTATAASPVRIEREWPAELSVKPVAAGACFAAGDGGTLAVEFKVGARTVALKGVVPPANGSEQGTSPRTNPPGERLAVGAERPAVTVAEVGADQASSPISPSSKAISDTKPEPKPEVKPATLRKEAPRKELGKGNGKGEAGESGRAVEKGSGKDIGKTVGKPTGDDDLRGWLRSIAPDAPPIRRLAVGGLVVKVQAAALAGDKLRVVLELSNVGPSPAEGVECRLLGRVGGDGIVGQKPLPVEFHVERPGPLDTGDHVRVAAEIPKDKAIWPLALIWRAGDESQTVEISLQGLAR